MNGRPVRYRESGAGDPVVLVHGLSGSTLWWARNLPALAERFRVLSVDLPGFGAMWRHRRDFVLPAAADWLHDWLIAMSLDPVHLIGHSMGGHICLRLAADHPATVRRLVLAAPAAIPTGRSVAGYALPLLRAGRHMRPSFLPTLAFDALRSGPRMLLRATRQLLAEDVRHHFASVRSPTLIIWGANDHLVPPDHGPILQAAIPDSRLIILPRAGHVVMYDRAAEFNRHVVAFLDEGVGSRE